MLSLYIAQTLDGYIARKNDKIDFLDKYNGSEGKDGDYGYQNYYDTVEALVMGRKTYELCLTFPNWPYPDKPVVVVTSKKEELNNAAQKKVLTKKLLKEEKLQFYSGDITNLAKELNAQFKNTWIVGGGQMIKSFLDLKLVEEMQISILPEILGGGIPLFPSPICEQQFSLVDTKVFSDGLVLLHYTKKL